MSLEAFVELALRREIDLLSTPPPASACGCALPDGQYGNHGWHVHRATSKELFNQAAERFVRRRCEVGETLIEARAGFLRWVSQEEAAGRMDGDGVHDDWRAQVGLETYLERCPAYVAACQRRAAEKKVTEATSRPRQPRLD